VFSYLLIRIGLLCATVLGALVLIFLIIRVIPGDPVDTLLGDYAGMMSPEQIASIRADLGLDKPLPVQFALYLGALLRGDFGDSFRTSSPVSERLWRAIGPTMALTFTGMLLAIVIGVPLGIVSAKRAGTWRDYGASVLAIVWTSAPGFWFAMLLIYFLAFRLGWFPIFGAGTGQGFLSALYHLALPAFTIGARHAGEITRMTRSCLLEVLGYEYVRTARAKGLPESIVFYKHALRNAGIPLVTVVGMSLAYLVGSAIIVEVVFARPGLGKLMADAMFARDYPTVQGVAVVFAVFAAGVNLVTDLTYGLIDPRIRYG
jgi:peptide/nickel transport system permease protein/oligopeptide transport system permease protein